MREIYIYSTYILWYLTISYIIVRVALRYWKCYIFYMFNSKNPVWDKNIDRPRIVFYQIGGVMILIAFYRIDGYLGLESASDIVNHISCWALFIFGAAICHSSWTKWFINTFVPKAQNKLTQFGPKDILPITSKEEELKTIYELSIEEKYLIGSFDSFQKLVYKKSINDSEKLKWIDTRSNNRKSSNTQSLINFITTLFPELENRSNSEIVSIIEKYFVDLNDKCLFLNTKNKSKLISDWRNNKSKYLKKVDNLFKNKQLIS